MSNLARMLKLYCRVEDIDVRKLATQLDVSAATVSRLQNGKEVSQDTMLKLINWLFEDKSRSKGNE